MTKSKRELRAEVQIERQRNKTLRDAQRQNLKIQRAQGAANFFDKVLDVGSELASSGGGDSTMMSAMNVNHGGAKKNKSRVKKRNHFTSQEQIIEGETFLGNITGPTEDSPIPTGREMMRIDLAPRNFDERAQTYASLYSKFEITGTVSFVTNLGAGANDNANGTLVMGVISDPASNFVGGKLASVKDLFAIKGSKKEQVTKNFSIQLPKLQPGSVFYTNPELEGSGSLRLTDQGTLFVLAATDFTTSADDDMVLGTVVLKYKIRFYSQAPIGPTGASGLAHIYQTLANIIDGSAAVPLGGNPLTHESSGLSVGYNSITGTIYIPNGGTFRIDAQYYGTAMVGAAVVSNCEILDIYPLSYNTTGNGTTKYEVNALLNTDVRTINDGLGPWFRIYNTGSYDVSTICEMSLMIAKTPDISAVSSMVGLSFTRPEDIDRRLGTRVRKIAYTPETCLALLTMERRSMQLLTLRQEKTSVGPAKVRLNIANAFTKRDHSGL
jgi:hypothetical protein